MKIKEKYYKETEYLLYNYNMFRISIENMKKEIEFIKDEDGMSGISYNSMFTSPTNKINSITEDVALSNSEKVHFLEHNIKRVENKITRIDKALEGLTDIEERIITGKYIEGKQWYVVAYSVRYSERHCKRIRTDAIVKIAIGMNGDKVVEK